MCLPDIPGACTTGTPSLQAVAWQKRGWQPAAIPAPIQSQETSRSTTPGLILTTGAGDVIAIKNCLQGNPLQAIEVMSFIDHGPSYAEIRAAMP